MQVDTGSSLSATGTVGVSANASGGNIVLNGNATAGTTMTLTAAGGAISGTGTLTATTLTATAANGIGSTTALTTQVSSLSATNSTAGNIQFSNTSSLLTVTGISDSASAGTIMVSTSGSLTVSGAISSNAGDISLCDTGAAMLLNATVNAGTANTVRLQSAGTVSQSAAITAANLGVYAGGAVTLTNSGNDVTTTFAAIAPAAISFTDSVGFSTGQVASNPCFTTTVNGVSTTAGNANINLTATGGNLTVGTPNGNVSANGSGSVTLLANNSSSSNIDINGTASSTTGPISVTAGLGIAFGATGAVSTSTSAAGANVTLIASTTGTITQSGTGTTVTGNALSLTAGGGMGGSSQSLVLNGATLTSVSSANNGNQYLADTATVQLTSPTALNAGTGTITLTGGTFQITSTASGNAIADTSPLAVESPGTLDLNNNNETVTSLSDGGVTGGSVLLGTATLTTGNSATNTTFSGVISGTGILDKVGSDIFTLSGLNTYTGVTNIGLTSPSTNGGTLTIGSGGAINNSGAAASGIVNINYAGDTLNGSGTVKGQVTIVASNSSNNSHVDGVTITVPTGGTGITVPTGVTYVQIGVNTGVTVNGGNSTSTGVVVKGSAEVENSNISGQSTNIDVNAGTAFIQGNTLNYNASGGSTATGLLVHNGAIVDAGQLSAAAPYYGNITGFGVSTGSNSFSGYTASTTSTNPTVPQAIRDLNTGTAPFSAVSPELSNNYSAVGPQLGRMDVPAENNTFGSATTLFQIEQVIFHDVDNNTYGFVSYGTSSVAAPTVVGNVNYYAANPSALGSPYNGMGTLVSGSSQGTEQMSAIRFFQVTFSSYVFLDPTSSNNLGLDLIKVNGYYGAAANSLIHASLASAVYNQSNGQYAVTWAVSGAGTEYSSLEDGNYSLTFNTSAIQGGGPGGPGLGSNPLSGGAALFHRLFGDSNGDSQVDNTDLAAFNASYRSRYGQTTYRAYFDFDMNGTPTTMVDTTDQYQFQARYMKKLNANGTLTPISGT